MAEFNRIVKLANNQGFTTGAPPKGVLVNSAASAHVKDIYGNGFTLERTNAAAGSQIFPTQISETITILGDAYVLF